VEKSQVLLEFKNTVFVTWQRKNKKSGKNSKKRNACEKTQQNWRESHTSTWFAAANAQRLTSKAKMTTRFNNMSGFLVLRFDKPRMFSLARFFSHV
jgi:predicted phage gp36 major capsid-like protein